MQPEINDEGRFAQLQKVTPVSKYLALILFIILPFVGGWIGYNYAPEKVLIKEVVVEVPVTAKSDIKPDYTALYKAQFGSEDEVELLYENVEGEKHYKTLTFSSRASTILTFNQSTSQFVETGYYIDGFAGDRPSPSGRYVLGLTDFYSATTGIQVLDLETKSVSKIVDAEEGKTFQSGVCGYAGPVYDMTWVSTSTFKYGVYKHPMTDKVDCEHDFELLEYKEVTL